MTKLPVSQTHSGTSPEAPPSRRRLLAHLTALVGSLMSFLIPGGLGLWHLAGSKHKRPQGPMLIPVATLDQVPDDGKPRRFPVRADRRSGWTLLPQVEIGSVYLIRSPGQKVPQALHSRCPHAGCTIALAPAEQEAVFRCPCHRSLFRADGSRIEPSPSPRDMDPLECVVQGNRVLVRFENFVLGIQERIVES